MVATHVLGFCAGLAYEVQAATTTDRATADAVTAILAGLLNSLDIAPFR